MVRLLARDTVEEIMYSRAVSKLHLTNTVIEEGRFSLLDQAQSAAAGMQVSEPKKITKSSSTARHCLVVKMPVMLCVALQLSEILKFGVDKLLSSDESSVQDVKLEKILGPSRDGQWVEEEVSSSLMEEEEEETRSDSDGQSRFFSSKLCTFQSHIFSHQQKLLVLTYCDALDSSRPHVLL